MNKYISSFIKYIKTDIGWMPFIFAAVMSGKTLGFHIPSIGLISYIALIVVAAICMKHGADFDKISAVFILYIPFALLLASPNPIFRSWMRYGLFVILYIAVSPFVMNEYSRRFRERAFKATLILCSAVSVISFICYFLGINMMRSTFDGSQLDYLVNTAGTFGGITSQSMLLGPISGVATLTCSYLAMRCHKRYWILAAMCAGSVLFAASRSALLATLCGEMVLFYFSTESVGKNTKRIIIAATILLVTYPLWNSVLDGLMAKNHGSIYSGINTDSRASKWLIRLDEWQESPIYGIGFCAVSGKDGIGFNGMIEPGSSWLAVLSMTGIVGFILFSLIYYRAAKNTLQYRTPEGALIGAVLILVGVHMLAEGHIFSGGSYLCFLVWLSIGCATDYQPIGENELEGEE